MRTWLALEARTLLGLSKNKAKAMMYVPYDTNEAQAKACRLEKISFKSKVFLPPIDHNRRYPCCLKSVSSESLKRGGEAPLNFLQNLLCFP
jgi:hypothetical protein